jgi:hypothetical protein
MKFFTLGLLGLASLCQAAQSTTKYSTTTMFIPPAYTGSATNIYASMITEDPTKTLYKLACQSDVAATSYSCKNDFDGVTYTDWGVARVDVTLNSTSYGCALFSDRAGVTSQTGSATAESRTLSSSESSLWMTAVTIVDLKKRKTTAPHATQTGSSKLCKRKVREHLNGGSDGGSSSGSTGSGADDDGDSGSQINKKPNNNNDDCSTASILSLSWAVVALGFGGYLGLNLA